MTRIFSHEHPDGAPITQAEVTYRFRCYVCEFVQDVKGRDEIPEVCPSCEKPQSRKKTNWIERPREREL